MAWSFDTLKKWKKKRKKEAVCIMYIDLPPLYDHRNLTRTRTSKKNPRDAHNETNECGE
jgi:hypothetical protein